MEVLVFIGGVLIGPQCYGACSLFCTLNETGNPDLDFPRPRDFPFVFFFLQKIKNKKRLKNK